MKANLLSRIENINSNWLGNIPIHWAIFPNRALFDESKLRSRSSAKMLSVTIQHGVIEQSQLLEETSQKDTTKTDKSEYKQVTVGDIVYNKMRAWQGAIGMSNFNGIVSPAYVVQRPRKICNPKYLHWLFRSPQFKTEAERWSYGIASDMWSLRPEHFKLIQLCLPPKSEQKAIVRYLDYMDKRIQKFLQAKKKLVELFKEQKQAIIHSAVTRGLDSNTQLKDSGIEWLGEIPEHWTTSFAKSHYEIQLGKMLQSVQINVSDKKVLYFKAQHVQWFSIQNSNLPTMWATPKEIQQFSVHSGDLLVCEGGEGGRCGLVKFEPEKNTIIQNALHRVRPLKLCSNNYLQYIMASISARGWFEAINSKATISHFTVEKFATLKIPIPPLQEQTTIVNFLNEATERIDSNINLCNRQIDLMQEYHTRLISDVVTGKLDVREAALNLPQDSDDSETLNQPQ